MEREQTFLCILSLDRIVGGCREDTKVKLVKAHKAEGQARHGR